MSIGLAFGFGGDNSDWNGDLKPDPLDPEVVAELNALLEKECKTIPKGKPLGWINIKLKGQGRARGGK